MKLSPPDIPTNLRHIQALDFLGKLIGSHGNNTEDGESFLA